MGNQYTTILGGENIKKKLEVLFIGRDFFLGEKNYRERLNCIRIE